MFRAGLVLLGFCAMHGIEGVKFCIEDAWIEQIDTEYFVNESCGVEVVWVDDTVSGISVNLTSIKMLPKEAEVELNLYVKTVGLYNTHSGITAKSTVCSAMKDPVLLGSAAKALGLTDTDCPAPPGTYGTPFWQPSTDLLPESFPGMDYKVTLGITDNNKVLLMVWVFVTLF